MADKIEEVLRKNRINGGNPINVAASIDARTDRIKMMIIEGFK